MRNSSALKMFMWGSLLGLLALPLAGLANGPEVRPEIDRQLQEGRLVFRTLPAAPVAAKDTTLSVEIRTSEGESVHEAWVEFLIQKSGAKGLGELVKTTEKGKGVYEARFRFPQSGAYTVEVSGNYMPLASYPVSVGR